MQKLSFIAPNFVPDPVRSSSRSSASGGAVLRPNNSTAPETLRPPQENADYAKASHWFECFARYDKKRKQPGELEAQLKSGGHPVFSWDIDQVIRRERGDNGEGVTVGRYQATKNQRLAAEKLALETRCLHQTEEPAQWLIRLRLEMQTVPFLRIMMLSPRISNDEYFEAQFQLQQRSDRRVV